MKNKTLLTLLLLLIGPLFASAVMAQADQQKEFVAPEWFLTPPADYMEGEIIHFISASWGKSYERALANAIIAMAVKVESKIPSQSGMESAAKGQYFSRSPGVSIVLDSIDVVGMDIFRQEESEDYYSDDFYRLFKVSYKNGSNQYYIDVTESETVEGEESSYSSTFTFRETDDGHDKFSDYLKKSPRWVIRKKEKINNNYFMLLEYREEKSLKFNMD